MGAGKMTRVCGRPEHTRLGVRLRDKHKPVWMEDERRKNGYEGAGKGGTGLAPDEIVSQVKDAGLKGRGGAGFSTGPKWSLVPTDESITIRYLLCKPAEMEPAN